MELVEEVKELLIETAKDLKGSARLCWLLGVSVLKQAKKESYHYLLTCHLLSFVE